VASLVSVLGEAHSRAIGFSERQIRVRAGPVGLEEAHLGVTLIECRELRPGLAAIAARRSDG
jgi:hypothetical protein